MPLKTMFRRPLPGSIGAPSNLIVAVSSSALRWIEEAARATSVEPVAT